MSLLGDAESGAYFSECGQYRYALWRRLGGDGGGCLFIMLNPSTADAEQDDPTIRRCIRYARDWGYGQLTVVNIFALRSTDPKALYGHPDPIGERNTKEIIHAAEVHDLVVCAWGEHGKHMGRGRTVLTALLDHGGHDPQCLGVNKSGQPKHPLYLRADAKPQPLLVIP